MRKTVLLFGGSFDPPHNGHMQLLRAALQTVKPDIALVMPTGTSPHKMGTLTGAVQRYRMCQCFRGLDALVRVSAHELLQKGKSYTVDTLRWLRKKYPGGRIVLVVGADMLLGFDKWKDWRTLLGWAELCCQVRLSGSQQLAAVQEKAAWLRDQGGTVTVCLTEPVVISSTELRQKIAAGEDVSDLIPAKALRIIEKSGLYRKLPPLHRLKRTVKANLSKKRWLHTRNVAAASVRLARQWGLDPQKARYAAFLHDFLKEKSQLQLLQIFADNGIIEQSAREHTPAAWHGMCAALAAKSRLGIFDGQILSAVACHTCGKAGMSLPDKLLYLADMISAERDWDGVDTLRQLCRTKDADTAMIWALRHTVTYLTQRGGEIDSDTLIALQDLESRQH